MSATSCAPRAWRPPRAGAAKFLRLDLPAGTEYGSPHAEETPRMPEMNLVQAINDALRVEMRRDPRVVVLCDDFGRFGGGCRATLDLQKEFGPVRCLDTPLAE